MEESITLQELDKFLLRVRETEYNVWRSQAMFIAQMNHSKAEIPTWDERMHPERLTFDQVKARAEAKIRGIDPTEVAILPGEMPGIGFEED